MNGSLVDRLRWKVNFFEDKKRGIFEFLLHFDFDSKTAHIFLLLPTM